MMIRRRRIPMSRVFRFNGPVTYIENNYEGVGLQHKNSGVSSEKKNDSDEVVFEQSVKVKCSSSAAGRTAEVLFPDKNGGKDVNLTGKMANAFVNYLKLHHISNEQLSTSDGVMNDSVAAFYQYWYEQGYLYSGTPNGASITRFLQEDCKLEMKVTPKSYGDYIRKKINAGHVDVDVECNVADYMDSI